MATDNPMGDSRLVPLHLPDAQALILRRDLGGWRTVSVGPQKPGHCRKATPGAECA